MQSYQRFQRIGHTNFNTSGTIAPRLLSRVKVGTHLGSLRKIAHSGSQGETGAFQRRVQRACGTAMRLCVSLSRRRRGPAGLRDPVVRLLMLRFSVSVRKVSAQSPVNAMRSSSHLNPSTTQPSSKNRTQRLTRRNVCALDVAILGDSCYTDGHRKPLKKFFNFFENCVRNGAARASI